MDDIAEMDHECRVELVAHLDDPAVAIDHECVRRIRLHIVIREPDMRVSNDDEAQHASRLGG